MVFRVPAPPSDGSATSTLIISNVALGDIGYYIATVGNSYMVQRRKTRRWARNPCPARIKTNMLIDPGFEIRHTCPVVERRLVRFQRCRLSEHQQRSSFDGDPWWWS
jgi:hypothetical protein